jgi:hypothetical protein
MIRSLKRNLLIYLLLCIIAVFIMGGALTQLEFKPGLPFPTTDHIIAAQQATPEPVDGQQISILAFRGVFSLLFIFAFLYFVYLLFRKTKLTRILGALSMMAVFLCVIYLLSLITLQEVQITPVQQGGPVEVAPFTYRTEPLPAPPIAWQWIVAAGLLLLAGAALWFFLVKHKQQPEEEDAIITAANIAMHSLLSGNDLRHDIMACYQSMSESLCEHQGLAREQAMTVREFEDYLENSGVPAQPVQQLSSIFESVRYSDTLPSGMEKQICLDSLQAIIQYCQKGK